MKKYVLLKELESEKMPAYMKHYTYQGEVIYKMYKTKRDKVLFSDKRIILFDLTPIFKYKKIEVVSYKNILSGEICFTKNTGIITLRLYDNNIQLKFIDLTPDDKKALRKLFYYIMKSVK